jgi:hypothetical protein
MFFTLHDGLRPRLSQRDSTQPYAVYASAKDLADIRQLRTLKAVTVCEQMEAV